MLTEKQKKELDIAQTRVDQGIAGQPTETNAGDVANLAYGKEDYSPVSSLSTDDAISTTIRNKDYLDEKHPDLFSSRPEEKKDLPEITPKITEEKPEEKPKEEGTFTIEEAREIWGDDFTGLKMTEDGKFKPDASAWERAGITGIEEEPVSMAEQDLSVLDDQMQDLYDDFSNYNIDTDPDYQNQVQNIRGQFDAMKRNMNQVNKSRENAMTTLGYRIGAAQYAGSVMAGIVGEEIGQGNERIAEINRKESMAVSLARQAFQDSNWKQFNIEMTALKDIRSNKADELQRYNDKLVNLNKNLREQEKFELEVAKYHTDISWKNAQLELDYAKLYKPETLKPISVSPGETIYDPNTGEILYTIPGKTERPITVSPGQTLFDPSTGEALFTAPKPIDVSAPSTKNFNGRVNQWVPDETNPLGGYWVDLGSEDTEGINDLSLAEKISLAKSGLMIDENGEVVEAPKPVDQLAIDNAQTKIDLADSILDHPGFNEAVGPSPFSRRLFNWNEFINSNANNFIADVEQIISKESLDSLIAAKAKGATFGALSDTEMAILTAAATSLGKLRKYRDNDTTKDVVGYKTTEKNFTEQIDIIVKRAKKIIEYAKAERGETKKSNTDLIDDYYLNNQNQREYIDQLEQKGYSDEDMLQILGIGGEISLGDTSFLSDKKEGSKGGQCGSFVNRITKLGVGDSYSSKMAKMDENIKTPKAGMVFTMPYKKTGHCGFIVSIKNGIATVKDSNWSLNEKIKTHTIPIKKMTGFAYYNKLS